MTFYSFTPLADVPPDHIGFIVCSVFCGIVIFFSIIGYIFDAYVKNLDKETKISYYTFWGVSVFCWILVYLVSFHFTDQSTTHYENVPVIGKMIGYDTRVSTGKSPSIYPYIIYEVDGEQVIMRAREGVPYPKLVTLYKN